MYSEFTLTAIWFWAPAVTFQDWSSHNPTLGGICLFLARHPSISPPPCRRTRPLQRLQNTRWRDRWDINDPLGTSATHIVAKATTSPSPSSVHRIWSISVATLAVLPYNWKTPKPMSAVYCLWSAFMPVYMLSMTSALDKTKKTRCRVFVEAVTTSTTIIDKINIYLSSFYYIK